MKRYVFTFVAAVILGGCTPEIQLSTGQPFTPEWCQAAKSFPRSGQQLYNVAICHERAVPGFAADENVIAYYLNESARWGNVDAGAALARRGLPVPDPDLRREADARRSQERQTQALVNAIRPQPQPRPQHGSVLFPGTGAAGPSIIPGAPRPVAPRTTPGNFGGSSFGSRSENRSQSERRECVNNVCKVHRTVCVNGACSTTVSDR